MWGSSIDSHVCEAVPLSSGPSKLPSAILSSYFGKPVHLVFKGRRPRDCAPTAAFPELKATAVYQDGYPLLVLSEESMNVLEDELRNQVGKQGVDERWRTDRLMIERSVLLKQFNPYLPCTCGHRLVLSALESLRGVSLMVVTRSVS